MRTGCRKGIPFCFEWLQATREICGVCMAVPDVRYTYKPAISDKQNYQRIRLVTYRMVETFRQNTVYQEKKGLTSDEIRPNFILAELSRVL